ncbi:hypothetical protein [Methylobacterium nodulans]|uniref:Uncharacterized protein n=1 Tax=Methylobacterium nodulans (strain LMG 21967 / CNCM I-2342 / ORS 2060) TaxID=460265 RepID=B8IJT0_METNO|nr:hypothetical protein [Methylobacterium nodulans]ACL58128.1 conserved hypothetical protein [Methylobacterium nodulans ORS 2060]
MPTVADLRTTKRLTDEQLDAAVMAYLADPCPGPRRIAEGLTLDIAAAVADFRQAAEAMRRKDVTVARRVAVRTAILLARPS